jgi:membrane fusion protein, multidrug efflux system
MNFQPSAQEFVPAKPWRQRLRNMGFTRRGLRKRLMIGVPLLVAVIACWLWFSGGRYVSTDNAYIHAPKLMVSSDVSGIVSDVLVHEGQTVHQCDVLFRIDPEQFKISLDNAKAHWRRPRSIFSQ